MILIGLTKHLAAVALSCTTLNCPTSANCDQQLGPPEAVGEDAVVGYSVNAGTGNLFLEWEDIALSPALGPPLVFRRYYNSQLTTNSGLGNGWTHTYSWRIKASGSNMVVTTDTGRSIYFSPSGSNWTPQVGEFGTLTGTAATGFHYKTKYGTDIRFDNTTSNSGRLLTITPPDNTAINIGYSSGLLISTVTSGNLHLTFVYTASQLTQITASGSSLQWNYGYTSGELGQVTFPTNGALKYTYASVTINGATFSNGGSAQQLTEVQRKIVVSPETYNIVGLYSYTGTKIARAASSAINSAFQNNVTFSYTLCSDANSTTTISLASGTKTITSSPVSGVQRETATSSTGGTGHQGEWSSGTYQWNPNLTLASVTDGNGNVTKISSYDSKGNPTTVIEAFGAPVARTTNITWHPVLSSILTLSQSSVFGGTNVIATYDYDSDYNTTYNQAPTNILHQSVISGHTDTALTGTAGTQQTYTSQIIYDAQNRVTGVTEPNGSFRTLSYWPPGSGVNKDNRLATVVRNTSGGHTLTWTASGYDPDGRLLSVTEPNGSASSNTFDQLGRVATSTVTQGTTTATTSYSRDAAGRVVTKTLQEGTKEKYEYDGAGRLWRRHAETATLTTPWSEVIDFDNQNRPQTIRWFSGLGGDLGGSCNSADGAQFCTQKSWDSFGRLSAVTTLGSNNATCSGTACRITFAYDNAGLLQSRTEAGINTTSFLRNGLNQITRITLPTGKYATLAYDVHGKLSSRRDPRDAANGGTGGSRLTTYIYDDFGRLVSINSPDTGLMISNYDGANNRIASKDGFGDTFSYSYDGMNRITASTSSVGADSVAYVYDEIGTAGSLTYANTLGRLTTVQGRDASNNRLFSHYSYDYRGRITDNAEERGPDGASTFAYMHYDWLANGELSSLTYPDGKIVTYVYPSANGYAPVPMPGGITADYNGGQATIASNVSYFADAVVSSLTYGNGDLRTLTRNMRGEWTHLVSGPSANPVLDETYDHDSNGLGTVTAVHFFSGTSRQWDWNFGYDQLNRLTSYNTNVRPVTDSYTWSYDEVGNRTQQIYNGVTTTYNYANNANSELTSLSGGASDAWSYRADGWVSTHTVSGVTKTYNYDTRERLNSLSISGAAVQAYNFDGQGRRWQRTDSASGHWNQNYYDLRGRLIEEFQSNGVTVNSAPAYDIIDYVYLGNGTSNVGRVVRRYQASCVGCGYVIADQDVQYVHENYRNAPFSIVSAGSGAIAWEGEVDPFGLVVHSGLPNGDGKIGTADDLPPVIQNYVDTGSAWLDPADVLAEAGLDQAFSRPSVGALLGGPDMGSIVDPSGPSAYSTNSINSVLSFVADVTADLAPANIASGIDPTRAYGDCDPGKAFKSGAGSGATTVEVQGEGSLYSDSQDNGTTGQWVCTTKVYFGAGQGQAANNSYKAADASASAANASGLGTTVFSVSFEYNKTSKESTVVVEAKSPEPASGPGDFTTADPSAEPTDDGLPADPGTSPEDPTGTAMTDCGEGAICNYGGIGFVQAAIFSRGGSWTDTSRPDLDTGADALALPNAHKPSSIDPVDDSFAVGAFRVTGFPSGVYNTGAGAADPTNPGLSP